MLANVDERQVNRMFVIATLAFVAALGAIWFLNVSLLYIGIAAIIVMSALHFSTRRPEF